MNEPDDIRAMLARIDEHLDNIDRWLGKMNGRVTGAEKDIISLRINFARGAGAVAAFSLLVAAIMKVIFR